MVSKEDIVNELENHPDGMLQIDIVNKLCKNRGASVVNPLLSLLKRKEIIRKKAKNGGFMIFLNEKNRESECEA